MSYLTLVPYLGRDYKSAKAVKQAWNSGTDFQIMDMSSAYDGKPINKEQALPGVTYNIRFSKLTKLCPCKGDKS